MKRAMLTALVLGSFAFTAGGCLVVSGKSIDERGIRVSQQTLRQIETGVTTETWLVATIGEPTALTIVEGQEHTRILRYDFTVSRSEGGAVFLIFAGGSDTTKTTRTFFEVVDSVVTRYWTEP